MPAPGLDVAKPPPKATVTELAVALRDGPAADLISALMKNSLGLPAGGGPDAFSGEAWSAAAVGDLLALPGTRCLLASLDGTPAGYLLARFAADEGEILSVGVCPAARRQGLAHALLAHLGQIAVQAGVGRLYLEVAATNQAALACYLADGWQEVARRPGYYEVGGNNRCDALVFSKRMCP